MIGSVDEIDNLTEKPGEKNNNRTEVLADVIEEDVNSGDTDDVYSKVFQPSSQEPTVTKIRPIPPRPAVRRKKRKEREIPAPAPASKQVSFDWLSGLPGEGRDQPESQVAVLKNMVYKLSVELGKEQGKRRDTGVQLDQCKELKI